MSLYTSVVARTIRCCFLEKVIEEFPYPIQRIQTDRGREFFAYAFQEKLIEYGIKFRPLKPASPHLNGKVERSQRTDLEEFYATADLSAEDLADQLDDWQSHYNEFRVHGSLDGRTNWVGCLPFKGRSTPRRWSMTWDTPVVCASTMLALALTSTSCVIDPSCRLILTTGLLFTCRTMPS